MQPVIKLEVTVPHIALPLNGRQTEDRAEADQQLPSEQLRLLPLGWQSGTTSSQYSEFTPAPTYDQNDRFCLFRLKNTVAQGGGFLLQILRMYPALRQKGNRREQVGQLKLSDNLAFTIELRPTEGSLGTEEAHNSRVLVPGLNCVVIYLDAEGKPSSYSIDGVKS